MTHPSSLATLIVASQLSHHTCTGICAKGRAHGLEGGSHGAATDRKESVDRLLHMASIALAVAFSVVTTLPESKCPSNATDQAEGENALRSIHRYPVVEDGNVRVMWTQRARSTGRRKTKRAIEKPTQLASRDEGAPESMECYGRGSSSQSPRTSTRRQRRALDTTSRNYSDFCDTDISRQIEAMVLEVETAYEHRHVKKSKHVINQSSLNKKSTVNRLYLSSNTSNALKTTKASALRAQTNTENSFQHEIKDKTIAPAKNSVPAVVKGASIAQGTFQLVQRTPRKIQELDGVPGMTPCDSLTSVSSDYSFGSRSSSDFLSIAPGKKTREISSRRNAEWAIIE